MTKLTINYLKSLKPTGKAYRRMDEGHAGFGVKVSPKGQISFIFRYASQDGRDVPMILGYFPETGLAEARELWRSWRAVYDSGRDPLQVKAAQLELEQAQYKMHALERQQEAQKGSLSDLLQHYVDDLKAAHKRSWSEAQKLFEHNVAHVMKDEIKAKDVLPKDISALLAKVIERDALITANRLRSYLSAAFTFGIQWDNDPRNYFNPLRFGINANPVRDVPKALKSEKPRERALSANEVNELWQLLEQSDLHPKTIAALRLLLALGGQRIEEVLKLTANQVDLENRLVSFMDTKSGVPHVVPFGEVALPILQSCLEAIDYQGALFTLVRESPLQKRANPYQVKLMPSTTLSRSIARLCKRHHFEPFQPKDLRRTVKTLMGFAGIRKEDRDRFQNHALTDVSSRHYDRYNYLAEKREVMKVWDVYLQNLLQGDGHAKVVPIRGCL
jgi:integrase